MHLAEKDHALNSIADRIKQTSFQLAESLDMVYVNNDMARYFISCIAHVVVSDKIWDTNSSPFKSIILDESYDKGHLPQLSICIKYLKEGRGHTVFYRLCELQGRDVTHWHQGKTQHVSATTALSVAYAIKDNLRMTILTSKTLWCGPLMGHPSCWVRKVEYLSTWNHGLQSAPLTTTVSRTTMHSRWIMQHWHHLQNGWKVSWKGQFLISHDQDNANRFWNQSKTNLVMQTWICSGFTLFVGFPDRLFWQGLLKTTRRCVLCGSER